MVDAQIMTSTENPTVLRVCFTCYVVAGQQWRCYRLNASTKMAWASPMPGYGQIP
jgi:hypothetical protein